MCCELVGQTRESSYREAILWKKSLFPVHHVAKIVVSRAATKHFFVFFVLYVCFCFVVTLQFKKKKNVPSRHKSIYPGTPLETNYFLGWPDVLIVDRAHRIWP